jgi:hypothetical protein
MNIYSLANSLIGHKSAALVVFGSPPLTAQYRTQRESVEFGLASIKRTQDLPHGNVTIKGSEILVAPRLRLSMRCRWDKKPKRLERKRELLIAVDKNFVRVVTWIEIVPPKNPVRIPRSLCLMKAYDVLSNGCVFFVTTQS